MSDEIALSNVSPEHLLTLYQITRAMNSSLDFGEVLQQVMDSVIALTRAQRGVLLIANDESGELEVRIAHGVSGETLEEEATYSTTVVNQAAPNCLWEGRKAPGRPSE